MNQKQSFLSFKLGDEIFAASVHHVLEVLEIQRVTKVPQTPDYIRGVINFRGEIIPVVDSRIKFKLPAYSSSDKTVIIVFEIDKEEKNTTLGAIADAVKDVIDIYPNEILDVPALGSRYDTSFLKGMIKTENSFIMILDINKVFTTDELNLIAEIDSDEEIETDEKVEAKEEIETEEKIEDFEI